VEVELLLSALKGIMRDEPASSSTKLMETRETCVVGKYCKRVPQTLVSWMAREVQT